MILLHSVLCDPFGIVFLSILFTLLLFRYAVFCWSFCFPEDDAKEKSGYSRFFFFTLDAVFRRFRRCFVTLGPLAGSLAAALRRVAFSPLPPRSAAPLFRSAGP